MINGLLGSLSPILAATVSDTAKGSTLNTGIVIGFILFFVIASIVITWWTSRSTTSTSDFYVAGKGVPWIQVGIAMTGSYLSAASFLGCAGDIGVFGIDSIWLSIGFFGGYMAVLLLIAGPLRNVGSYTVAGALHRRFPDDRIKLAVMICTVVISTFYLVPQMLGAGLLFEMLLGWDFLWVTVGLGVLMSIYIIFGGMKSTLYNQVVQAVFLWVAMVVLTLLAFFTVGKGSVYGVVDAVNKVVPPDAIGDALGAEYAKDPAAAAATTDKLVLSITEKYRQENPDQTELPAWLTTLNGNRAKAAGSSDAAAIRKAEETAYVTLSYREIASSIKGMTANDAITCVRQRLPSAASGMTIGVKTDSTLAMISTVIALVFGTAGLPHILIMFFTVPSARAAKKSVTLCIVALGIFYLCAIALGFLLFPAIYPTLTSWVSQGASGVGLAKNMAVLEISNLVGGPWLMAIGAAGAVAAILSTSAGLMITVASSISHDLYKVYINPNATEKQELGIAKITTLIMSAIAVSLAVMLKNENIAWLVMLAFGIAASAIFPAMLCTLWWKRTTRQAVIASILTGLSVSVLFIVLLFVQGAKYKFLGLPVSGGPGIFGVSASFLVLLVVSFMTTDTGKDPDKFLAQALKPDGD